MNYKRWYKRWSSCNDLQHKGLSSWRIELVTWNDTQFVIFEYFFDKLVLAFSSNLNCVICHYCGIKFLQLFLYFVFITISEMRSFFDNVKLIDTFCLLRYHSITNKKFKNIFRNIVLKIIGRKGNGQGWEMFVIYVIYMLV